MVKTQTVEVDDFAEKIKDFGPGHMYDAMKSLLTHAYIEEEILNHTVSGKQANSKFTDVKHKQVPSR